MGPTPGDHLIVALIAVAYPLYTTRVWYRRDLPGLRANESRARLRFYRSTMIELWLLTAATLSWWTWVGRTVADVGLGVPGGLAFWIGAAVVVAIVAALGRQVAVINTSTEAQAQVRKQFGDESALIIPRDRRERRAFLGLSLTAGFCEEVLYRAVLISYLMVWLPWPVAVTVAAIAFGAAHFYLGRSGVVRATATGAVLGLVYLVTDSLWLPIVLHATVDIVSGFSGSAALNQVALVAGGESRDDGRE